MHIVCCDQFSVLLVLNSPPKLKDLYNLITPEYAAQWKVIGTLLDIRKGTLDAIEGAYPTNMPWCCNKLLETWLDIDTNASWKKIIQVINTSAVAALKTGNTTFAANPQQGNYYYHKNTLLRYRWRPSKGSIVNG